MYLNVTSLLCKSDKIVGFEADVFSVDEHQLPVLEQQGVRFMSGLDIELFIEELVIAHPNQRNNVIVISNPDFRDMTNVYYYKPDKALLIEPPMRSGDELMIKLRQNSKDVNLFFKTGSAIYRNVISRVCADTEVRVLKTQQDNARGEEGQRKAIFGRR